MSAETTAVRCARSALALRSSAVVLASLSLVVACGGDNGVIDFDYVAPTTVITVAANDTTGVDATSTTSTTQPDITAAQRWVDATTNLEGIESYCGNLSFVSARPGTDHVYASVSGQGWFINRTGSDEWEPFGRAVGSADLAHRGSSMIYDPDDPDRFWESGYFGLGPPPNPVAADVNRTDDGGELFISLGNPVPADLVSIDFSDPERRTLLAGGHGSTTVSRSADGGESWEDISAGLPDGIGESSYPHVLDSETFLLGTHKGEASGIFLTTDGGATWTKVFDQGVAGPPLASSDGGIYWVIDVGGGVVGSSDQGRTWDVLPARGPVGGERRGRIVELDDGSWVALGDATLVVSRDSGQSWRRAGPQLPFDPRGFTYSADRKQAFLWNTYCDFEAGVNPVLPMSIMRLDLDLEPGVDDETSTTVGS